VVETDAGEFGKGDGEQREIHAADPETEGKYTDRRAGCHACQDRGPDSEPGRNAEMHEQRR